MIAVVADDLSGAAEVAAVGWRIGLTAQVRTAFSPAGEADLVVVDTDTRSASGALAQARVQDVAVSMQSPPVQWIYKKVDSVLRGHVGIELETMLRTLGKSRAILAPANPSRGRIIAGGRYLVDDQPLDRTDFARDPDWPARTSRVSDLVGPSGGCPVRVLTPAAYNGTETGIVVAETRTAADLAQWAGCVDEQTLAAGGADFFQALVDRRLSSRKTRPQEALSPLEGPRWFVCGSASEASHRALAGASGLGTPVCPMPEAMCRDPQCDEALIAQWADAVVSALTVHGCAIAALHRPAGPCAQRALTLRIRTAALVRQVLGRTQIGELFIEGGATARAVLDGMGWEALTVLGEYGPGVVRLSVRVPGGQVVTLKPGSYPWPEGILDRKED